MNVAKRRAKAFEARRSEPRKERTPRNEPIERAPRPGKETGLGHCIRKPIKPLKTRFKGIYADVEISAAPPFLKNKVFRPLV